jgi:ferric-dicitrate binding protein FerR (iron transport regulator)/Mg-chelatase subunit ChlD/tetratricopeptide (TPR) repeat protein
MTRQECLPVHDDLADLVAGDPVAIDRHSEHLASCDDCRDARYEASRLVELLPHAGSDHLPMMDLVERVLVKAVDAPLAQGSLPSVPAPAPAPPERGIAAEKPQAPRRDAPIPITSAPKRRARMWAAIGAAAAVAAGGIGVYAVTRDGTSPSSAHDQLAAGQLGTVKTIDRAAKDKGNGLEVREGTSWRPLRVNEVVKTGAELRTDERTRAAIELADGSRFVLDHETALVFDGARRTKLTAGRIVADVVPVAGSPASIDTPSGRVDVVGTRFALTATAKLTVVQVVRGSVVLATSGANEEVRAGEEGVIENGAVAVNAAPGLAREVEWSELGTTKKDTEVGAGLGALRAYKPGEKRDRDWNLALANHDVKVRIVGPVARTEITETFRNDSNETLEGVYQFPLPPDAQIDALALDVKDAPGGFEQGAFLDKQRAQKIWNGVIDKATPKKLEIAQDEIIWVDGSWRDPALLDWKRGGRFELRIFPIPPKGARTIKIAYTQIVTPRGPWRQYVYPLPHSADGSTVADEMTVDVEVRGSMPGQVRAAGYDLNADPARAEVNALTLKQTGFVPRGDLVVDYRAADGDAEVRAWTFAGGFAVAPDDKLAKKKNVGIDEKVIDAQRLVASDVRPTAVLALRPKLPRWREARSRDYMIVVDASQSMVGERYTRAAELTARLVEQMDRRDQFSVMACDSECRKLGALRSPSVGAAQELGPWLAAQPAAGASDVVAAVRAATAELPQRQDRERWIVYVGDGFASTGFRKAGDVEKAIAESTKGVNVTTIGIGTDADSAVLGAVARGGGGSYLAWVPGQSVKSAAIAGLESTFGSALRDAKITLPSGLADVAPTVLPTVRAGEEVLIAARMTGDVTGDVIVKGTVGGQPFEQRYPLKLAVSTAAGNGFVPRLWASLAIDQIERNPNNDRARIVALSQGYGVMSKETSLLVLESAAMFDAFGVDRTVPAAKWTGQEAIDEVVSTGTLQLALDEERSERKNKKSDMPAVDAKAPAQQPAPKPAGGMTPFGGGDLGGTGTGMAPRDFNQRVGLGRGGFRGGMFAMRRTWVRVPSISQYDSVNPSIVKAIGDAERALAKSPDSRERHRALVQALSYAGEIDRANQLAAKWLERDRLDPQALGYQADLLGRDGKRELALRMLAGVVDLDADRAASHERMVQAYEHVGRMSQACSHRIALASIAAKDEKAAAGAIRCLRSLSRDRDAELVLTGLADEATRAATEKALLAPATLATGKQDLVVDARWEGGDDLDISLVTPDGTRVSWMGGRTDVRVTDATSTAKEQLAIKSIRRGNYLIEVARGGATPSTVATRGTVDIVVLGTKKSMPFELQDAQARKIVARLAINLEERVETIDPSATKIAFGNIPNPRARQVMLARSGSVQQCFTSYVASHPGTSGRIMLTITVAPGGSTTTRASASGDLQAAARCVEQNLSSMHVEGTAAGTFRVPLTFRSSN